MVTPGLRYNKSIMGNLGKSYKELEKELSEVLARVEGESYDELDALIKDYDKGMKIIDALQDKLTTAKNVIKKAKK